MARSDDKTGHDKGKVKVRVIEFELDGSNQTLRESIKDIVGAIGRTQFVRVGTTAPPAALPGGAGSGNGTTIPEGAEFLGAEEAAEPEDDGTDAPRKPRPAPRTPQVLDLDLRAGTVPLTEFLTKLNVESDTDRYAAIAYWMQAVLKVEGVSADHIHTGYRSMKWTTPRDASSPLRTLKGRDYGYMKSGPKTGTYLLNHVGEDHVIQQMKALGIEL